MRLCINYRGKKCKKHKHMEAKQNNTFLKIRRSLKKSKGRIKKKKNLLTSDSKNMMIHNPRDAGKFL